MLVLTRKLQERIHVGDNVTITIVRIQGNTVRVGIEAPHDVRVVRGELIAVAPPGDQGGQAESDQQETASASEAATEPAGPLSPVPLVGHRPWRRPSARRPHPPLPALASSAGHP